MVDLLTAPVTRVMMGLLMVIVTIRSKVGLGKMIRDMFDKGF